MVVKPKNQILPPTAEDLPYSVLLVSAGHASLSLSLSPLVGMLEFILHHFSLKAKETRLKIFSWTLCLQKTK